MGIQFVVGSITGEFDLNNMKAVKAIRDVGKEAQNIRQTVGQAMEGAGADGGKGFLKGLNAELGKKSMLGQITKLAMGGGAIAGASMLGRELAGSTKELADLADQMRENKMTTGEFTEKIAGSIPVLGNFWQAGRNIRELITGEAVAEQQYINAINRETQAHEKAAQAIRARAIEIKSLREFNASMESQTARLLHPEMGPKLDFDKNITDLRSKASGFVPALDKAGNSSQAMADITRQIDATEKALREARDQDKYLSMMRKNAENDLSAKQKRDSSAGHDGPDLTGLPRLWEDWQGSNGIDELATKESMAAMKVRSLTDALALQKEALKQGLEFQRGYTDALTLRETKEQQMLREQGEQGFREAGELAKTLQNSKKTTSTIVQLPNPILQAEEMFGPKTVVGSNPGSFVEKTADAAEETAKGVRETNGLLGEIAAKLGNVSSPPMQIQEIH